MAYSAVGDLLVGDMMFPAGFDKGKYISVAADEMDSKLGFVYELPIRPVGFSGTPDVESWKGLPMAEQLLLKTINNKLASGRLIMDIAVGSEQAAVHAYGSRMVNEALRDLMLIANNEVALSAVLITRLAVQTDRRTPSVKNQDSESLLLGFENTVLRGEGWLSRPGVV